MKFLNVRYVSTGSKACEACATLQEAPCEMYTYLDRDNKTMDVCFGCRIFCTPDRTVSSFRERNPAALK